MNQLESQLHLLKLPWDLIRQADQLDPGLRPLARDYSLEFLPPAEKAIISGHRLGIMGGSPARAGP